MYYLTGYSRTKILNFPCDFYFFVKTPNFPSKFLTSPGKIRKLPNFHGIFVVGNFEGIYWEDWEGGKVRESILAPWERYNYYVKHAKN